ncbi:hypothetical protein [Cellulosimicrobium sp. TH-20]|uniref:hypothetical protein n=1 Tax=Cellulosimicrobium sp. TH-20 TaxID=1980001 RepID=UPI0011A27193|nr:hypothetical protein [Cellulosimicrobium sp. TH-20]
MAHVFELTADHDDPEGGAVEEGEAPGPASDEQPALKQVAPVLGAGLVLAASSLLLRSGTRALWAHAVDTFGNVDPLAWQTPAAEIAHLLHIVTATAGAGLLTLALMRAARILDHGRHVAMGSTSRVRTPWRWLSATTVILVSAATALLLLLPDRTEPQYFLIQDERTGTTTWQWYDSPAGNGADGP